MIIKNKKSGTNVLAYRQGLKFVRLSIKAHQVIDIPELTDFEQIVNKTDFENNRGWFEVVENKKKEAKETILEKAKKEAKEYASETDKEENNNNKKINK